MGYVAKKVRARPDGSIYWQVVFEDRRKNRPANIPREQSIHRDQLWPLLGIDEKDNFEKAQQLCRDLNARLNLEKKNTRALAREAA